MHRFFKRRKGHLATCRTQRADIGLRKTLVTSFEMIRKRNVLDLTYIVIMFNHCLRNVIEWLTRPCATIKNTADAWMLKEK